nr:uncharacterized protein LOC117683003 [Crassostrea gigas]XP_034307591.1 uncharacterized protein LOC117683003 [Crassostrea gigas]XP_034307592.1 uncharacterized protein LOC117683003 [Crassostrea gigas]XP_034307593.1 uncharacterized protein LOC117683003 [Crassostrea gigas]XP_034307594.1 uncharacterized protein LOC117683003 [Crassostrea gigas]
MNIMNILCKTLILFHVSTKGFSSETTTLPAFQRKFCLEDAILIHDDLFQKGCPYRLSPEDKTNCSIPCTGKLDTNNSLNGINHRIDYMLISQNDGLSILRKEYLNFSNCIIETITIKCDFKYQKENRNKSDCATSREEGTLPGSSNGLVSVIIGCLLGVVLTLIGGWILKILRQRHRYHKNLDLNPICRSINNPVVYTEIEELRMLVKATQVPSIKDNSPLSARSRTSNTYHTLAEMESLGKSTTLIHDTDSGKLRTSNHSSNGSRLSLTQSFGCSVKEDEQQRESGDSKKYFELEEQKLA